MCEDEESNPGLFPSFPCDHFCLVQPYYGFVKRKPALYSQQSSFVAKAARDGVKNNWLFWPMPWTVVTRSESEPSICVSEDQKELCWTRGLYQLLHFCIFFMPDEKHKHRYFHHARWKTLTYAFPLLYVYVKAVSSWPPNSRSIAFLWAYYMDVYVFLFRSNFAL